jgi:hypothetical protein
MALTIAINFMKGEIEMKRVTKFIAISAFSLMVLALPSVASAQWSGNNGGYGYPNGGNNQARYYGNIEQVADRLKDRSRDFERQVDREYNNNGRYGNNNGRYGNGGGILGSILNGGRNGNYGNRGYGNDQIKRLAEDFRRAASDFENKVDGNSRNMYRGQQAANRMLSIAAQIDRQLYSNGRGSSAQYQWNAIRSDLNIVANAYGYGNQNRGRGNRNGRFPF